MICILIRDSPVQSIIFEELDSGGNEIRASAGIGNEIEVAFPPQCLSGHCEREATFKWRLWLAYLLGNTYIHRC